MLSAARKKEFSKLDILADAWGLTVGESHRGVYLGWYDRRGRYAGSGTQDETSLAGRSDEGFDLHVRLDVPDLRASMESHGYKSR